MKGLIKVYNSEKGFGFISSEDGQDYFFHIKQVVNANDFETIERNDKAEFTPNSNEKGLFGEQVKIIK